MVELSSLTSRKASRVFPGLKLARFAAALRFGDAFAATHYRDTPDVIKALDGWATKAAVTPLTVDDDPSLVDLGILDEAARVLLAGVDALEACAPFMRQSSFGLATPAELTTGTAGDWAFDAMPLPAVSNPFNVVKLVPHRAGALVVLADELIRDRAAERVLAAALLNTFARTSTTLFLSPDYTPPTGSPELLPPPITSGAVEVSATADLADDVATLVGAIMTGGRIALLGQPALLSRVGLAVGAALDGLGLLVLPIPSAPTGVLIAADLGQVRLRDLTRPRRRRPREHGGSVGQPVHDHQLVSK